MKTLFKIVLFVFILVIFVSGAAIFVVTRPSVQKAILEGQLPDGSRLERVQVTLASVELKDLSVPLPDGTRVTVGAFQSDFDLWAAIFDRSLNVESFRMDGFVLDVPRPILAPKDYEHRADGRGSSGKHVSPEAVPQLPEQLSAVEQPTVALEEDPFKVLYQLEGIDWLLNIDSILLDGEIRDSAGSAFGMRFETGALRPGEETEVRAELRLHSANELEGGLKEFEASTKFLLDQNLGGGFNRIEAESMIEADDALGVRLVSISQAAKIEWDAAQTRSEIDLSLSADLLRPGVLLPELESVRDLDFDASVRLVAEGGSLMVEEGSLSALSEGEEVVSLELKRPFDVYGKTGWEGELVEFAVNEFPLAWTRPWLPSGMSIVGEPISMRFALSGTQEGGFEIRSDAPIRFGPVSVYRDEEPLLLETALSFEPVVSLGPDQLLSWEISELALVDAQGPVLRGASSGQYKASDVSDGIWYSGIRTETHFDIGLLELSQQPVFDGQHSLLSGRLIAKLSITDQLNLSASLRGLSARTKPGLRQDYLLAVEMIEGDDGAMDLGASLRAGTESRPTTAVDLDGPVFLDSKPLKFDLSINSETLSQSDFDLLAAAFSSVKTQKIQSSDSGIYRESRDASVSGFEEDVLFEEGPTTPPWAGLDGRVRVDIDRLELTAGPIVEDILVDASVSESLLEATTSGTLLGGLFEGAGKIQYVESDPVYDLEGAFALRNLELGRLSQSSSKPFPLQGFFDLELGIEGEGRDLESALNASAGRLNVSGREGNLTAFQLDGLKQFGVIGAGLLGHLAQRPGISALAGTIPYFQSIPYDSFLIEMKREGDERILIPQLRLTGESVLIEGSGMIATESFRSFMTEPLHQQLGLDLKFGARGRLVEHLDTLQLLGEDTTSDGYQLWRREVHIGGTVGKPDTTMLTKILNEAARRVIALRKPNEKGETQLDANARTESSDEKSPSDDEELRRNVETGIQLLNSIFGN